MGSMTMDYFINIFLDLLHYVPYIKDEKVKIQQFLGCLPPNFRETIEFDMPKTLDTTLHKSILCYEDEQLKKDNIKKFETDLGSSRTTANLVLKYHPP